MSFLEESWKEREEIIYKEIFENTGEGIFTLSNQYFERLNAKSIDPRWLHHGVFKCPPTGTRKNWAYITSGMSNPWEADVQEEYSGLGVEFIIETLNDEPWAIDILLTLMAYNLMLASGEMGDVPLLDYGHRIPLALSTTITAMMLTEPVHYPDNFKIQSGCVDLIQIVGITDSELEVAKATSSDNIKQRLLSKLGSLVIQQDRDSII